MLLMSIPENIISMLKRAEELIDDLMKEYKIAVDVLIIH